MDLWREQIHEKPVWKLTYTPETLFTTDTSDYEEEQQNFEYLSECDASETYFTLVTTKNVVKGEQALLSYGQHSNSLLLLDYGFAYLGNPYECVPIQIAN